MSMLANAFGLPPRSVRPLRFAAMSIRFVFRYAAATWAAEKRPAGCAAGIAMPAAPLAKDAAGEPKKGSAKVGVGRLGVGAGWLPGVGPLVTGAWSAEPGGFAL